MTEPQRDSRPLEEQIPPSVVATPADAVRESDAEIRWWRPGWSDVARHVGWRWLLLTPVLGVALIYAASWYVPIPSPVVWIWEVKLSIWVIAVAISLAGFVLKRVARARREPFCIYCGYNLTALPDNYRCPECGRPYTWALIEEYRRDPNWFIERWRKRHDIPPASPPFEAGATRRRKRNRDGTE